MRSSRLLFVALAGLAGCRSCQSSTPAPLADAAIADAAVNDAMTDAAVDAGPPPTIAIDQIRNIFFSPHAQLAFLFDMNKSQEINAFRVVDLRSGHERMYAGTPPTGSELGFDNRCDVSASGYMPNIDVWYMKTDPTDTFFVRTDHWKEYRENAVLGVTVAPEPEPEEHPGISLLDDKMIVYNVTIAFPGTDTTINHVDRDTGLLVVERPAEQADDNVPRRNRCAFDLHAPTKPPICVVYQPCITFEHELASPDGKVFVWNSVVWGSTKNKADDYWERDDSHDKCFLEMINLDVGKTFKTQSPCALTAERPLRFEDNILVTDDSNIYHCSKTIERRYDVKTGAFRGQKTSPPFPEDVAPEVTAEIKKQKTVIMSGIAKPGAFATVYGLDGIVSWSEGKTMLARKGGNLLLCTKLTGECGPPIMPFGENDVGGVSKDGSVFGVITNGHLTTLDGTTGAKKIDVALIEKR